MKMLPNERGERMSGLPIRPLVLSMVTFLLPAVCWCQAQNPMSVKVDSTGIVRVSAGTTEMVTLELNAHAPGWVNAPQSAATGQLSDLPGQAGKRFVGTLPIPSADGPLQFTETLQTLPQGLQLQYDVSVAKPMKLSGLQVSLNLPTARYAGKELVVNRPDADAEAGSFPQAQSDQTTQIWSGTGDGIAVAKGSPDAVSVQLQAATDILVYDLRKWEHPTFEIRFPAIWEDAGRSMTPGERFHLELTILFAAPVKLATP